MSRCRPCGYLTSGESSRCTLSHSQSSGARGDEEPGAGVGSLRKRLLNEVDDCLVSVGRASRYWISKTLTNSSSAVVGETLSKLDDSHRPCCPWNRAGNTRESRKLLLSRIRLLRIEVGNLSNLGLWPTESSRRLSHGRSLGDVEAPLDVHHGILCHCLSGLRKVTRVVEERGVTATFTYYLYILSIGLASSRSQRRPADLPFTQHAIPTMSVAIKAIMPSFLSLQSGTDCAVRGSWMVSSGLGHWNLGTHPELATDLTTSYAEQIKGQGYRCGT